MITITENDEGVISAFGKEGKSIKFADLKKNQDYRYTVGDTSAVLQVKHSRFTRFIFLTTYILLYSLILTINNQNK